ncbi:MAG: hypothetical protein A2934_04775 [Candidatus Sungbacteria bacterium RIFCSPLOWO2_01_FULL_47_10]|uniref:HTH deoR-type domain-containing protein n=1 Tax=Candidatus Sungbacteria bacterium RIFCSPLOWO2_01_FULL_47_10 TaxID=1802276 RepID=A0A1G2L4K5_9BACT|nr:MAG: hypothetical protein A2934_04775 [Candidatus Sungbacteria bacterium RIFCSPLOWO2_01_FULL_47_10]
MTTEMNKKIFELTLAVYRVTDLFPQSEALRRHVREKANEITSSVCEYCPKANNFAFAHETLAKIQSIRTLLGIARFSRLSKPINIAVLDREYDFFANYFEREFVRLSENMKAHENPEEYHYPLLRERKNERKPKVERSLIYSQRVSLENGNGNGNGSHEIIGNQSSDTIKVNGGKEELVGMPEKTGVNRRQKTILDYLKSNDQVKSSDLSGLFEEKLSIKTLQRDLSFLVGQNIIERQGEKRWAVYKLRN